MPSPSDEKPGEHRITGVAYGKLLEVYPDRIVLARETLYLPEGMTCGLTPGTYVEVVYHKDGEARPTVGSVKQMAQR